MNKTITISEEDYKQLKWDSEFLESLEAHGVNNWDGYGNAYTEMMDD